MAPLSFYVFTASQGRGAKKTKLFMRKVLSVFLMMCGVLFATAQTTTLTFTGRDANNQHIQLNRVVVANLTRSWQETLYYPDTILTIGQVGIHDYESGNGFVLLQNNPNPFDGTTYATLRTVESGDVVMIITDMNGRTVETQNFASLPMGIHQFRINVANTGTCMLTARQNGKTTSIKMVNKEQGATNRIEYLNFVDSRNNVETQDFASLQSSKNNTKGSTNNPFVLGDEMIYTGYVTVNGTEHQSQMIHQNQFVSENFVFNFNISAPTTGLATVTTDIPTDVLGYTATCGGNVIADGGYSVIARGVCWSTSTNPVFNDDHVSCGDGLGSFSGQLAGLGEGTTYYVRAYAVNSVGTAYGNQVSFTTATYPTVTTDNVSNVTCYSATCGGNITSDGGADVIARGVCWSTSPNPTIADNHTMDGTGIGNFTSSITTYLTPNTTYYVRAYATNSVGTVYGEQRSFTTTAASTTDMLCIPSGWILSAATSSPAYVMSSGLLVSNLMSGYLYNIELDDVIKFYPDGTMSILPGFKRQESFSSFNFSQAEINTLSGHCSRLAPATFLHVG